MNIPRKVAANSGILLINKLVIAALSLLIYLYLIRYLGSARYGKYSIVFAYLSFFQILSLGFDQIIVREISKDNTKQNSLIGNAILIKLFSSVVGIFCSWIVLQFIGYDNDIKFFIYIASLSMLLSFGYVYVDLFQAYLKVAYYTISELVVTVIFSGLTLLLIFLKAGIFHFILLQTIGMVPLTIAYIYFSKNINGFKPCFKIDFSIWKNLVLCSLPILFSSIFISINHRIDQIMLFNMLGEKPLGLYSSIVKLTESLNFIPSVFMVSIFPLLSSIIMKSNDKFIRIYRLSFKYISIIIIPIAFGTTLLSERIISIAYGHEFLPASNAFSILIWSAIFVFLGSVNANVLISSGLQKYIILFTVVGALTNIILNLILIPKYSIVGASISTVISYSVPGLSLQYLIKETRQITKDYFKSTFKPIICSVLMSVFIYYFLYPLNIAIIIIFSILAYFGLLLVTKCFDEKDWGYLSQIIRNHPKGGYQIASQG